MTDPIAAHLESCRRAEKEQALFYRRLAAEAEARGEQALAQRFHDLHADEQHHLSRLTARLIELGRSPLDLGDVSTPESTLAAWEASARARERAEVERYEELLRVTLDPQTKHLVEEILETERAHAEELGGKWTMA